MLTVVVAVLSDKWKMRGPFMLIFLPIAMAGESEQAHHQVPELIRNILDAEDSSTVKTTARVSESEKAAKLRLEGYTQSGSH